MAQNKRSSGRTWPLRGRWMISSHCLYVCIHLHLDEKLWDVCDNHSNVYTTQRVHLCSIRITFWNPLWIYGIWYQFTDILKNNEIKHWMSEFIHLFIYTLFRVQVREVERPGGHAFIITDCMNKCTGLWQSRSEFFFLPIVKLGKFWPFLTPISDTSQRSWTVTNIQNSE